MISHECDVWATLVRNWLHISTKHYNIITHGGQHVLITDWCRVSLLFYGWKISWSPYIAVLITSKNGKTNIIEMIEDLFHQAERTVGPLCRASFPKTPLLSDSGTWNAGIAKRCTHTVCNPDRYQQSWLLWTLLAFLYTSILWCLLSDTGAWNTGIAKRCTCTVSNTDINSTVMIIVDIASIFVQIYIVMTLEKTALNL